MKTNNILIAVRPKTNSSYTAKKMTILSKLDLHYVENVPHIGPDDDLSEWKAITRQDLQDIEDAVYAQIFKDLDQVPNSQHIKDAALDDPSMDIVSTYVWSIRKAHDEKDIIQHIASMIETYYTVAVAKGMYSHNTHVELIIKHTK